MTPKFKNNIANCRTGLRSSYCSKLTRNTQDLNLVQSMASLV